MDVLLVAAKKEKIADYTGVIAQAGRTAVVVDVDAFALQNAYEVNYGIEPGAVVVLLNAGASATNINILSGEQSVFTRDVSIGGNAYTEALQRELNLPYDVADQLKRGDAVDGVTFDEARPVLRAVTENVMLEIQKTFDFFKATAASDRIDRIIVSGGASRAEGFTEMLAERFGAPVEALRSLQAGHLRRAEARRRHRRDRRRPPRWRSASRCGGWGTDDSHQPSRGRARRAEARRAVIPAAHRVTIAASLILLGTALAVGWWFWSLRQTSQQIDEDIARAETETQQLRSVIAQVQKFEARKAQLQQRVTLIEQLRRGQSGPVHLVDEISKAVPERLWLTELTQKGQDLTLGGHDDLADRRVGLRRQPRDQHLVQEPGRHHRQRDVVGSEERRPREVLGEGDVQQPGRRRRRRRRSRDEVAATRPLIATGRRPPIRNRQQAIDGTLPQQTPVVRPDRRLRASSAGLCGLRLLELLRDRHAGRHRRSRQGRLTALRPTSPAAWRRRGGCRSSRPR